MNTVLVAQLVSDNYFTVLGVKPAFGRFFLPDEDTTPGGNPVVVLSYGSWQRRFGGDRSAVGRTVSVNGTPFTVIEQTVPIPTLLSGTATCPTCSPGRSRTMRFPIA